MPLNTQILRDGENMSLRWSGFHVAAMVIAASADSGIGPYKDMESFCQEAEGLMEMHGFIGVNPGDVWQLMDYGAISMTPLNSAAYVLKKAWKFHDNGNGEMLELLPGDVLRAWRN